MKLSEYLAENGITASEFAKAIERSVSTVTRLIHGSSKPDWSTLARIEEATDGAVQPNDFRGAAAPPAQTQTKGDVDEDLVRALAGLLEETGLAEIEYGGEGWHVRVAKGVSAPAPAPAVDAQAAEPQTPETAAPTGGAGTPAPVDEAETFVDHPGLITAPMVGIVYTAENPDSPPFVKVGDAVEEGQTLLLIEAMKVFNPIIAPRAGTVARVLVGNGAPVEYGEPLLVVD